MRAILLQLSHLARTIALLAGILVLTACSHTTKFQASYRQAAPLELADQSLSPQLALEKTAALDILALDAQMRKFVDRTLQSVSTPREKLRLLQLALRNPGLLGIQYNAAKTATAKEAFYQGEANCLTYANLFIAMARYAGLSSFYQQVSVKPLWDKHGPWLSVSRHVNVAGDLKHGVKYSADLKPVEVSRQLHQKRISDRLAHAQHFNNLAMNHLINGELNDAYKLSIKALSLAPQADFLWSNLGLVYKHNRQYAAAQQSYKTAIALNPDALSAYTNLLALYTELGDTVAADDARQHIAQYQQRNPYHHARQGQIALIKGDLMKAINSFNRAIDLKHDDAVFYFALIETLEKTGDRRHALKVLNRVQQLPLTATQKNRVQRLNNALEPMLAAY